MRRILLVSLLIAVGFFAPRLGVQPAEACETGPLATIGALPASTAKCAGIRPGQQVASSKGRCTMNFLFNGSDGHRYMGVAGHCVIDSGERTWAAGTGPLATVNGQRVGEWSYAVYGGGRDFALVRLDAGVPATGELMHFGGPTGLYTAHAATPSVLHHYGQISTTGNLVPARSMVALNTLSSTHVSAAGTGVWGDSGSAVIDSDGLAVGVLVTLGGFSGYSAGTNGITRLDNQLGVASSRLGVSLSLVTAPLRTPLH